jgi:hypothetical protein
VFVGAPVEFKVSAGFVVVDEVVDGASEVEGGSVVGELARVVGTAKK